MSSSRYVYRENKSSLDIVKVIKATCSENDAGSETLDGADADDMTQAGGGQQRGMAQSAEEGWIRELCTFVGVLDGGFANTDGDHVAHDHHQSNLGRPGDGGGCDGEK